jgi:hypothetical protein
VLRAARRFAGKMDRVVAFEHTGQEQARIEAMHHDLPALTCGHAAVNVSCAPHQ